VDVSIVQRWRKLGTKYAPIAGNEGLLGMHLYNYGLTVDVADSVAYLPIGRTRRGRIRPDILFLEYGVLVNPLTG
jgi:hypothetical protein